METCAKLCPNGWKRNENSVHRVKTLQSAAGNGPALELELQRSSKTRYNPVNLFKPPQSSAKLNETLQSSNNSPVLGSVLERTYKTR